MTPFRSLFLLLFLCSSAARAEVSFNEAIRPLLAVRCFACHGPDEKDRKSKLRLDTREDSLVEHQGFAAIVPGDLDESELIYRITSDDEDEVMPPPGKGTPLTKAESHLFKQWIKEGAKYEVHWSYQKPVRPEVPEVAPKFGVVSSHLLPNPTEDQLIATAFHRNTKTNNEGRTSDEEFRNAAVVDRVNTTMATWMGTTAIATLEKMAADDEEVVKAATRKLPLRKTSEPNLQRSKRNSPTSSLSPPHR